MLKAEEEMPDTSEQAVEALEGGIGGGTEALDGPGGVAEANDSA